MIRSYRYSAVMILVVGGLATMLAAWGFYRADQVRIAGEFRMEAEARAADLSRELSLHIEALYALSSLFSGSELVTQDEFSRVAGEILRRHPDLLMLQWVPRVDAAARHDYETASQQALADYQIREGQAGQLVRAAGREVYFPIHFIEPLAGNEDLLGLDHGSFPRRRQVLEETWLSGQLRIVSGETELSGHLDRQKVLAFLPVFQGRGDAESPPRTALLGFAVTRFDVGQILMRALKRNEPADMDLSLWVRSLQGREMIIHHHPSRSGQPVATGLVAKLPVQTELAYYGELKVLPTRGFFTRRRSWGPQLSIFFGLQLVMLAFWTHRLLYRKTELIDRQAQQLQRANQALEQLSYTDGLTGIANRRCFDETLAREWTRAARDHRPMTLIMVDIDHFKLYNDSYGHQAGDRCLRQVAAVLERTISRPADLVARYGGEEFVLQLPGTSERAIALAEECRQAVEQLRLPHASSPAAEVVTISLGVCTLHPGSGCASREMVEGADRALYQAKQQGRNRVMVEGNSGPRGRGGR